MAGSPLPPPPPAVAAGPSTQSANAAEAAPALAPGTFTSVLPALEDVLELIYGIAEGEAIKTEDVVAKAKAISTQLQAMKKAASTLPGGHLGAESVSELTRILEAQAASKRAVLKAFLDIPTPAVDAESNRGVDGGSDTPAAP
ncbi:uncharacterized protein LOC62_07G009211 [Vanrija pseudolonga]|uniref:Mediator complex subunit 9 n=1 Tax=Vanrija pseudolonga TaxID=143232 RepID=A0AAF0YG12_9TREE|nr:hypothetical protein LOC62_07G009211 [Vanrija pseudolonga]